MADDGGAGRGLMEVVSQYGVMFLAGTTALVVIGIVFGMTESRRKSKRGNGAQSRNDPGPTGLPPDHSESDGPE